MPIGMATGENQRESKLSPFPSNPRPTTFPQRKSFSRAWERSGKVSLFLRGIKEIARIKVKDVVAFQRIRNTSQNQGQRFNQQDLAFSPFVLLLSRHTHLFIHSINKHIEYLPYGKQIILIWKLHFHLQTQFQLQFILLYLFNVN